MPHSTRLKKSGHMQTDGAYLPNEGSPTNIMHKKAMGRCKHSYKNADRRCDEIRQKGEMIRI